VNQTPLAVGTVARWSQNALPWAAVLTISMSLAYAMNTAAVGALSPSQPPETARGAGREAINPCALDADGALYTSWEGWQPAGRTAFCRGETYPGVAGRTDMATQLAGAGRLLATITFAAGAEIRIDLNCPDGNTQRTLDAEFVPAAEIRDLYARVCRPTAS
jgi:hypothetical protein